MNENNQINESSIRSKRRSLFDTEQMCLPVETCKHPSEYVEKVKQEIQQWKTYVLKNLDDEQEFKREYNELKSRILDESVLSSEQLDFLGKINFDKYMIKAQDFCIKLAIHIAKMDDEDELEELSIDLKEKIQKEIFEK